MKNIIFATVLLCISIVTYASEGKNFAYRFQAYKGESYTYETQSDSQEEAYERAATACFQHYKEGRRISMDQGLDIIDICANPRRI